MATLPIVIDSEDKIAIIAPHPDDECIGVGGILSLYPELCDVFVLTDGRYGGKGKKPEVEKKIRKKQFENEMNYAKVVCFRWLGYEDGDLLNHKECLSDIDFSVYTKIFLPWGDDNHTDHTAAYMFAIERLREQNIILAEIYQYEVHVPFHDVTHYLDITDVMDYKKKLIRFHEDQISCVDYDEIVTSLNKYRACQCNHPNKYYEAYLRVDINNDSLTKNIGEREKTLQKYKKFYRILIRWISISQDGYNLARYLYKNKWKRVTIYGYADIGQLLYKELVQSGILICNILDKRPIKNIQHTLDVQRPEKGDNSTDVVIVTAVSGFDEIKVELNSFGYKNVISLQEILENME